MVVATFATTAISVQFNFLGRDFYNSIAAKQPEAGRPLLYDPIYALHVSI